MRTMPLTGAQQVTCSYLPRAGLGLTAELKRLDDQARLTFPTELRDLLDHGLTRTRTILDLGCGSGAFIRLLRAALPQADVSGADVDAELLSLVPAPTLHLDPDGSGVPDSFADDVIVRFVAQHLPTQARARLWRTAARALVPGGRLHVIDVNDADAGTVRPWVPLVGQVYAKVAQAQADRGGDRGVIAKVPAELRGAGFADIRPSTSVLTSTDRPLGDFEVHLGPRRHLGLLHEGVLSSYDIALLEHAWNQIVSSPDAFVSLKTHMVHARKPYPPLNPQEES